MTQLITRTRTILLTRTKIGHILFKVLEVEENSSPEFASNGARRARYPDGCASTFKFAGVLSSKCPTIDRTLSSRIWTTTVVREVLGGEMKRLRNPRIGTSARYGQTRPWDRLLKAIQTFDLNVNYINDFNVKDGPGGDMLRINLTMPLSG